MRGLERERYVRSRYAALGGTLIMLGGAASPAMAQYAPASAAASADEVSVDDIVVTARRRAESLINVPVAITAIGTADIDRYGAPDLKKIAQLAPQVIIAEAGSGAGASFSIRGIGSPAVDAGIEQTVAVNIDGLLVSRGRIVRQGFFDMQQVEVLKGPQALFFGKNSPAGVISITTVNPGDELEGFVRAGYEFVANERYVEAAIGGPVTERFKVRLAGRASKMDGFLRNTARARSNPYAPAFPFPGTAYSRQPSPREILGRLTVLWDPTDTLTANLKVTLGRFRSNGDVNGAQTLCQTAHPTANGLEDPDGDCELDRRRSNGDMPPGFATNFPGARPDGRTYGKQDSIATSLTLNQQTENLSITSVTGYFDLDVRGFDNFTYSNTGRIWAYNSERSKQFSQEVRLVTGFDGPLNLTLGGYFEDLKRSAPAAGMVAFVGQDAATGRYLSYIREARITGNTYSAFGQVRWNLTPEIELAGGVRYTQEKRKLPTLRNVYVHPLLRGTFALNNNITGSFKDSNWSPEATLTWHPITGQTLYAAYKTGYKSGGFSLPGTLTVANNIGNVTFGSESAKGGEVGYKAQVVDRRLRLELTGYSYTFSDLQQTSYDSPSNSFFIRNAAKARSRGFELSGAFRVTPGFQLRAGGGYNQAKFRSFPGAPCYFGQTAAQGCVAGASRTQDLSGHVLVRAPKWVFNGGANYDLALNDRLTLGLSGDTNYSGSYFTQENFNPVAFQRRLWLLNAAVKISDEPSGLEMALIGRNLNNKYYISATTDRAAGGIGEIGGQLQRPREIVVQGTLRF